MDKEGFSHLKPMLLKSILLLLRFKKVSIYQKINMSYIDDEKEKKEERFSSVKTYVSLPPSITSTMFPSPSRPKSVGNSFYKYNEKYKYNTHATQIL